MFHFQPKTEEEIKSINLIEEGIYEFQCANAVEKTSKSGNPMIELTLKVWDKHGRERSIFDYLIDLESMLFKIKHFCDSTGMEEKYKEGKFSMIDCIGKCGKAKIVIQKDKKGKYADKNSIADYVKQAEKEIDEPDLNDEIPF